MGLRDVLNGMMNGPRGQRQPGTGGKAKGVPPGRYRASSPIKRLRVTTGEPSRQTRSRKTRTLRHAGGYKGTGWSDAEAAQDARCNSWHT